MKHLLVGGHGIIGTALRVELQRRNKEFVFTGRRNLESEIYFDLLNPAAPLPSAEIVYLVAGMPSFAACETDRTSWLVNVDGVIAVAKRQKGFLVYISSDAVEWCGGTALARQKAHVEAYMRTIDAAIIRPSKVAGAAAASFARFTVDIGSRGEAGVYRWA